MNLRDESRLNYRNTSGRYTAYRMLAWAGLTVAALWLFFQVQTGVVEPLFMPTPTPTRTAFSWAAEGQVLFEAGNLDAAIEAYQQALSFAPDAASIWIELAQIQTYSSALLTTDAERLQRLRDAENAIAQAIALEPDNSMAYAVRAFIKNWLANPAYGFTQDERVRLLNEAEGDAVRASQLDRQNMLAQVYYAEILLDQQKWAQASQTINQVLQRSTSLMDAHRVHGLILETFGEYSDAIRAYGRAAELAPNLTFLYIYIALNYRQLELYDQALDYFARAAAINEKNGVADPLPYIGIAKTYSQQGEFFIAARNAERALSLSPYNPNTYGQLGDIYVRARNYEGALPVLKCAVYGCTPEENEAASLVLGQGVAVQGLPLTSIEVAYYYVRYASVLASLNMCDTAEPVLVEVLAAYGSDSTIAAIVAENREICRILQSSP